MIAACLQLGISKRELMEDYYPAELPQVLRAWGEMHGAAPDGGAQQVEPMTFFGTGGERIDG